MGKVLITLVVFASLSAGCATSPTDAGSTGGSGSIGATATSGGGTTIGGGTTTGTSSTGTSGSTGGFGIDGGAVMGIACGDAGTCNASEYCVKKTTSVAAGPPVIRFNCDAVSVCNTEPDCNCFTSMDAGVCYDPHTPPVCVISSGTVECAFSYP